MNASKVIEYCEEAEGTAKIEENKEEESEGGLYHNRAFL